MENKCSYDNDLGDKAPLCIESNAEKSPWQLREIISLFNAFERSLGTLEGRMEN